MGTGDSDRHDVVVVGGRVAGSATAMLLARVGHDAVLGFMLIGKYDGELKKVEQVSVGDVKAKLN